MFTYVCVTCSVGLWFSCSKLAADSEENYLWPTFPELPLSSLSAGSQGGVRENQKRKVYTNMRGDHSRSVQGGGWGKGLGRGPQGASTSLNVLFSSLKMCLNLICLFNYSPYTCSSDTWKLFFFLPNRSFSSRCLLISPRSLTSSSRRVNQYPKIGIHTSFLWVSTGWCYCFVFLTSYVHVILYTYL